MTMTVMTEGLVRLRGAPAPARRVGPARSVAMPALAATAVAALAGAVLGIAAVALGPAVVAMLVTVARAVAAEAGPLAGILVAPVVALPPAILIAGPSVAERIRERRAGR